MSDISRLNNLHEAPLLHVLKRRFSKGKIYTFCGHVLLSVNPYQFFTGLYDLPDVGDGGAKGEDPDEVGEAEEPHVYTIARLAFDQLTAPKGGNQSIVVSGESGAGKTEASKHVMRYLLHASSSGDEGTVIQQRLLDSNVVLEAFGNAKTVRNDNSSRFGKYIMMKYDGELKVVGARTDHFLLEKSRLIRVDPGERNYHIFYQICASAVAGAKPPTNYSMLNQGAYEVSGVDDRKEYAITVEALKILGLKSEDITALTELLVSLLELGNCKATEQSDSSQRVQLDISQDLPTKLGVDGTLLSSSITVRMQTSGRGSTTAIPLTTEQALNNINALIKYTYDAVFKWLVVKINAAHKVAGDLKFIGILDIFGFEIMKSNSFEQLCINFANEMLQRQFNEQVFVLEAQRYEEEGLNSGAIEFQDNQPVIDLISKRPTGLFIILEEHGMMSRKPDNKALVSTYHRTHSEKHSNYAKPRFGADDSFLVKHFAGDVTYEIQGFIEKNNDSLTEQLLVLMGASTSPLVKEVFSLAADAPPEASTSLESMSRSRASTVRGPSGMAAKKTVSSVFRSQLGNLVSQLQATTPHYIKCVKPNAVKLAGGFSNAMVVEQLRYSGVLEVVRIRRQGYPVRMPFDLFSSKFEILRYGKDFGENHRSSCQYIGEKYLEEGQFQIGKTKIFLRDGVLEELNYEIKMFYWTMASRIQSRHRRNTAKAEYTATKAKIVLLQKLGRMQRRRREYKETRSNIAVMQRAMRGKMGRKMFHIRKAQILLERKQNSASEKIQAIARGKIARQKFKDVRASILIQSNARRFTARSQYKKNRASTAISKAARMRKQRKQYVQIRQANQTVQNKIRQTLAKKELAKLKQQKKELDASVVMASMARMRIAKKKLVNSKRAAVALQCGARCMKARKILFSEKTKARLAREALERKSATRMQGLQKMYKAREERRRRKDARDFRLAALVQCSLRRWRTRSKFLAHKRAVTVLQNAQRTKMAKQQLKTRKDVRDNKCAVLMQSASRKYAARSDFKKKKRAMTMVQSHIRRLKDNKDFKEAKFSAVMLQKRARLRKAKAEYVQDINNVKKAQAVARCAISRRDFLHTIKVVTALERATKAFLRNVRLQGILLKVHRYAKMGKVDEIVMMLDESKSYDLRHIRNQYDNNKSLLHSAAVSNSVDMVALLCSNPDDVFAIDKDGNSPFHVAAKHSSFNVMKFFADNALNAIFHGSQHQQVRQSRLISSGSVDSQDSTKQGMSRFDEIPPLKEGFLKKHKEWRGMDKRWVVLRPDKISYFKRRDDYEPIKEILLREALVQRSEKKNSFLISSPLLLDKKNPEGRMYFQADSEAELQSWLVAVRKSNVQTGTVHKKDRSYLNLKQRSAICRLKNLRGETALHLIAMSPPKSGSVSIEIALWLAENGEEIDVQNIDGMTGLHLAIMNGNVEMAAALVRKGADMSIKDCNGKTPLDLIQNPKDVERICMVANISSSQRKKLLSVPHKAKDCTYLTLYVEKVTLQGAGSLECPFIRVSLYNNERELVEDQQEVAKFAHQNETNLFFATRVHLQAQLENLPKGSFLLLELMDEKIVGKKVHTQTLAWAFLMCEDESTDTTTQSLECYEPPVRLHLGNTVKKRKGDELIVATNGAFLSVDTYLTSRAEEKMMKVRASKFVRG